MDIERYHNFVVIVEEGTLSEAARKLNVAQPALSNQLKALEQMYGTTLLLRGARRLELTDAGHILYERAKCIEMQEESAKQEVRDCINGLSGYLRIGLTFSSATSFLDGILLEFQKKYPKVRYQIYETETMEILELLKNGVIEVGVVQDPVLSSMHWVDYMHRDVDRFVVAYHKDSGYFKGDSATIQLSEIANIPICVARRFETTLINMCTEENIELNLYCVNTQIVNSVQWAKKNLAVAILPISIYKTTCDDSLDYKIIEEPKLVTGLSIVTAKNHYRSTATKRLLELCSERFL